MVVENPMVSDSGHARAIANMLDKDHNCTLANHVMASPLFGLTERDLNHVKIFMGWIQGILLKGFPCKK